MQKHFKSLRIMAIAPSSRGFGFAIFDGYDALVDFGTRAATEDKNSILLAKIDKFLVIYRPQLILLPETTNRGPRTQFLAQEIVALAKQKRIRAEVIPMESVQRSFFGEGYGTKHQIAEIVAKEFPKQLAKHLPPKRKDWMSEDRRMDIFGAVALAMSSANVSLVQSLHTRKAHP